MNFQKEKDIKDEDIIELLSDAFKKLEATALQDTKVLSDMNNSLNWILTISGFIFAFFGRQNTNPHTSLETLLLFSNFIFVLLLAVLIIHKIFMIRYESIKNGYLENLRTHFLELKYGDLQIIKSSIKSNFFIVNVINDFRNGNFIRHPSIDQRATSFLEMDRQITR